MLLPHPSCGDVATHMCSTPSNRGPAAARRTRSSPPAMPPAPRLASRARPLPWAAALAAAAPGAAAVCCAPAQPQRPSHAVSPATSHTSCPATPAAQPRQQPSWPPTRVPGAHLHLDEAAGRHPEGDQVLLPRVIGGAARGARDRHIPGLVAQAAQALGHLRRGGAGAGLGCLGGRACLGRCCAAPARRGRRSSGRLGLGRPAGPQRAGSRAARRAPLRPPAHPPWHGTLSAGMRGRAWAGA
jgi:hypothetical protein